MVLSDISIKRPVFITMIMLAFVVLGGFAFRRLSVDEFPNVDMPVITVTTVWPGAGPELVESDISKKIEESLNTVAGVKQISSQSLEGAVSYTHLIAPGFVVADLAQALGARLLLVGRTQLGTINHTLLTLAEARRRGLLVCGVILNRLRADIGPEESDTLRLIASHGGITPLGPFPWSEQQDGDTLATLAARHLPIEALFEQAFDTKQSAGDGLE